MFHSQCFLSRKGPLRSVWVAAYCFNKLKKSQVTDTDISSSVDKVLKDEFDAVAYRVLAYFLLGIVRIYSKKVEYLFSDCNKVLVEVKDFAVSTIFTADTLLVPFSAPHFTITLPKSFQLDAFDLGILEDASGCNVLPLEDITLRDVTRRHAGSESLILDKFHSMDVPCQDRGPTGNYLNDMLAIEYRPGTSSIEENLEASLATNDNCHQDSVEREMLLWVQEEPPEIGTSYSRVCQPEDSADSNELCMQKVWDDGYCEALSLNVDMFFGIETKHLNIVEPPEAQTNTHDGDRSEIELITEEFQDTACLQDQPMDYEMCPSVEKPLEHFATEHKDDAEPVDLLHATSASCMKRKFGLVYQRRAKKAIVFDAAGPIETTIQIYQPTEGDCDSGHVEASTEKLLDSRLSQEKIMQPETLSPVGGRPECATSYENHREAEPIKPVDSTPSGNAKYRLSRDDCALSVTVESTPESKFPNTSGINTTPEFFVLPTPAAKDTVPTHRRRKCIFDNIIVLPNDLIKRNVEDPSELVTKRRKIPRTALDSWRAYRLSDLHQCLMEPLIPCSALGTTCLPSKRRSKISETKKTGETRGKNVSRYFIGQSTTETVEPTDKSEMLDTQNGDRSVRTPVEGVESVDNLGDLIHPVVDEATEIEPQAESDGHAPENASKTSEQSVIAPGTPVRLSIQTMNPPTKQNTPEVGYVSEHTTIAPETPMQYTGIMRSYGSPERPDSGNSDLVGQGFGRKKGQEIDFNSMDEDMRAEDEVQNMYGWSESTGMVARFLQNSFQEKLRNGEDEAVNLLQLLEGRTKKESARVFYEILVMKSKGHVDVKQESGYGEVVVQKASQWSCDE